MTDYTTQRIPRAEIPGCALVQDLLPLYLDDEVTHESHVLIAEHLLRCERCSGYLAGARSVRTQMLREQQVLNATRASGPTIAQLQQPVHNSLGRVLWLSVTTLLWLLGLVLTCGGFASGQQAPTLLGLLLFTLGFGGMMATKQGNGITGKIMLVFTALGGLLLVVGSIADPHMMDRAGPLPVFFGLVFLAIPPLVTGSIFSHARSGQPATPSKEGATGATSVVATVVLTIFGVLIAAILMLVGLVGMTGETGSLLPHVLGPLCFIAGVAGLLEINRRRSWVADLAGRAKIHQVLGWTAIGAGLWSTLLVLGMQGYRSLILALIVSLGLLLGGWAWLQQK
ncbi:MAG: zf-HC2 domain-containing protein [Herpetosiphonaceae bacterium]|nr:zf-HC2 domain-containing protein [Herpetosiphonaceae bacterium]